MGFLHAIPCKTFSYVQSYGKKIIHVTTMANTQSFRIILVLSQTHVHLTPVGFNSVMISYFYDFLFVAFQTSSENYLLYCRYPPSRNIGHGRKHAHMADRSHPSLRHRVTPKERSRLRPPRSLGEPKVSPT
jgi:hypothetical protein